MVTSAKEKLVAGEMYYGTDSELVELRRNACRLTREHSSTAEEDLEGRQRIIKKLFGRVGEGAVIEPPLRVDYGFAIHVGNRFYSNFGLVILDGTNVTIGDDVMIGPNVHIYTASHPVDPALRKGGYLAAEYSAPVTIGNRVWIGGGAIINPGKTIGDGSVIGSGSVVTNDIPPYTLAVGNPCRVIRQLEVPSE